MNKLATIALLTGLAFSAGAHASPLSNGNFASGLKDWSALGDVSVQSGVALLTTASLDFQDDFPAIAGAFNFSRTAAAAVGAPGGVETFAGLPIGSLDPDIANGSAAYEGSVLKQSFSVSAGDTLSFNWKLLSNEGASGFPDYAFVVIDGVVTRLATGPDANHASSLFNQETAGTSFSHSFASAGFHTLSLGVVDVNDYNTTTALAVSNVLISAVPEPESYALLLAGLGFVAAAVRRRKKTFRA